MTLRGGKAQFQPVRIAADRSRNAGGLARGRSDIAALRRPPAQVRSSGLRSLISKLVAVEPRRSLTMAVGAALANVKFQGRPVVLGMESLWVRGMILLVAQLI